VSCTSNINQSAGGALLGGGCHRSQARGHWLTRLPAASAPRQDRPGPVPAFHGWSAWFRRATACCCRWSRIIRADPHFQSIPDGHLVRGWTSHVFVVNNPDPVSRSPVMLVPERGRNRGGIAGALRHGGTVRAVAHEPLRERLRQRGEPACQPQNRRPRPAAGCRRAGGEKKKHFWREKGLTPS
jgi:hypothetical protein